jgi:hypothetical protein
MALLRGWRFSLETDDVLAGQGLEPSRARTGHLPLVEAASEALAFGLPLLAPAVVCQALTSPHEQAWKALAAGHPADAGGCGQVTDAGQVIAAVCTVGEALERASAEAMADEPLLGLALDGLGTAAVEALADGVCRYCEALLPAGAPRASVRMSPGVGLPLAEGQRIIFGAVDAAAIGVTINEGSQMRPAKSLSMLVAIGETHAPAPRPCAACDMRGRCRYQTLAVRARQNRAVLEGTWT